MIPEVLSKQLVALAEQNGSTESDVVRNALRDYFRKEISAS